MIPRRKKKCKSCQVDSYIWAHGLCQRCAAKESKNEKKEKGKSLLKRQGAGTKGKREVFEEIWAERPHVSQVSGKPLLPMWHKLWHWQFSHILPHGLYAKFELDKRNIILKTTEEHTLWQFSVNKIKDDPQWAWVFELREQLKNEYHGKI